MTGAQPGEELWRVQSFLAHHTCTSYQHPDQYSHLFQQSGQPYAYIVLSKYCHVVDIFEKLLMDIKYKAWPDIKSKSWHFKNSCLAKICLVVIRFIALGSKYSWRNYIFLDENGSHWKFSFIPGNCDQCHICANISSTAYIASNENVFERSRQNN